jgi:hypothetical protein
VKVDHGRFDALVSEKILDCADIYPVGEQGGSEGMSQGVAGRLLLKAAGDKGAVEYGLYRALCVRRMGNRNEKKFLSLASLYELFQILNQGLRENGDPVLVSFRVHDPDRQRAEVKVPYPDPDDLSDPKPGTEQHRDHEAMLWIPDLAKYTDNLASIEECGEPCPWTYSVKAVGTRLVEDDVVEKPYGVPGDPTRLRGLNLLKEARNLLFWVEFVPARETKEPLERRLVRADCVPCIVAVSHFPEKSLKITIHERRTPLYNTQAKSLL